MELIDERYLEFVRRQPCCACGGYGTIQAHHVQTKGAGRCDYLAVPLCVEDHTGWCGVGNIGRDTFQREHGINFAEIIYALLSRYTRSGA